ncbi:DUF4249 family protein [uncultured Hymenobacter sp.]|uniref:DUF4249 family protein n=1 Tax=uncultured Hymenobacter sp. TaxID=170016 RepID=UPI0035CB04DF
MNKLVTLLTFTALLFSGCETIVEVDTPPHTPRLAITYTLANQAPTPDYRASYYDRGVFVSTSQSVLERKELTGRGDATVELLNEAGQIVEQFRSVAGQGYDWTTGRPDSLYGHYVPVRGFVGEPGRTYTLRASAPGVEAVEATLTLPENKAVIETGSFVAGPFNPLWNVRSGRLTVSFLDNASTTDYYVATARALDRNGKRWGHVVRAYNDDPGSDIDLGRFQLSTDNSYNLHPFNDANSNGQRLTFSADLELIYDGKFTTSSTGTNIPEMGYIEVVISRITFDTYSFYQSMKRYYDTENSPFAEPAPLFSNVRQGFGIFGGATDVTYRIPL